MTTALDSSVILDVLTGDPRWADASEISLRKVFSEGSVIIGESVLAEITPALPPGEIDRFLSEWKLKFVPSSQASARLAGEMYRVYLQRKGGAKRVLPDFLIASHALCHADRLLARDRGYYRDYFADLSLIQPILDHREK